MPRLDLLKLLVKELRNFVPNGLVFDMGSWKTLKDEYDEETGEQIPESACKTACCAIGLGIERIPEFSSVLKLIPFKNSLGISYPGSFVIALADEETDRNDDNETLSIALGISMSDADLLFQTLHYPERNNPYIVADRIEEFINKEEKTIKRRTK